MLTPRQLSVSKPAADADSSGFEHLVLSFADVAYQYQANTAEYCDKSTRVLRARRVSAHSQMHSVGCSSLSQALRIAASARARRWRREFAEWRDARNAHGRPPARSWQRGRAKCLDDASGHPGLHGTCNSGHSVTWASGDASTRPWRTRKCDNGRRC